MALVTEDSTNMAVEAATTLEELGLSISSVRYVPSAEISRDRLVDTSPELGSTVRAGSSVELLISSGMVQVPKLVGMTQDEARQALEDLGLSMEVKTRVTSSYPAGAVISQASPAASRACPRMRSSWWNRRRRARHRRRHPACRPVLPGS